MATPEQWGTDAARWPEAILELRARIETLEANSQPTPNPVPISSSLVQRVSCAIDGRINPDQWLHQDAARAAIREVAAWIKRRQEDDYGVVIPDVREVIDWLEREAKR